ncbi:antitoxin [Streptomyces sp. NPDC051041]|uniref:antitoxin n=1 Tax=Streptomyces sp. NPDC051041 TaxID=3365640 RepID=UPI003793C174
MGIFDKIKSQVRDKAKRASEASGQRSDERTGGTYEDRIDTGRQRAEGSFGMDRDRERRDGPEEP